MRENINKAQEISTYKTRKCQQTLEKKNILREQNQKQTYNDAVAETSNSSVS